MRKIFIFALVFLLSVAVVFAANCGDTISTTTTLTGDVGSPASPCPGNGLVIGANSITLDCAGYTIYGNATGNGIYFDQKDSVIVKNCNIDNFSIGIAISTTATYTGSDNNLINNSNITNCNTGIILREASSGNNITNVDASNLNTGLEISRINRRLPDNNLIANNNFSHASGDAIRIISHHYNSCVGNIIINNDLSHAGEWSVDTEDRYNNLVIRLNVSNNDLTNSANGISVGSNSIIRNEDFSQYNIPGTVIRISYPASNSVIDNVDVSGSGTGTGIFVIGSNNNITNVTGNNREIGLRLGSNSNQHRVNYLNNYIADNNFDNSTKAIQLECRYSHLNYNNTIVNNDLGNSDYGIFMNSNAIGQNDIYHNNIYNNTIKNIYATIAAELSKNGEGNYWGHNCSNPFTAGVDSNALDVVDSYPYGVYDGWLTGETPCTCGDNYVEPSELCDGSNVSGLSCEDVAAYTGGVLLCNADCQSYDLSQCTGYVPEFSKAGKVIVSVIALIVVAIVASMLMKKKK